MRGTDVTPEQIEAARAFLLLTNRSVRPPVDTDRVALSYADYVRMLAWYGAIRYEAGAKGIVALDKPAGTEREG